MLGILLVGVGVLALFGTFLDIKAWHCWPLIVVALGFVTLFTPGKKGWSLVRAGHAICLVAIGLALQLWTLGLVTTHAFVLSFLHLWPVILIMLGLFVIGGATGKSVFKLLSSLLFAAALLFGVWSFGSLTNPLRIDLPGVRGIEILLPSPDLSSPESDPAVQSGGLPTR
jgi:phage shock protein C